MALVNDIASGVHDRWWHSETSANQLGRRLKRNILVRKITRGCVCVASSLFFPGNTSACKPKVTFSLVRLASPMKLVYKFPEAVVKGTIHPGVD